MGVGRRIWPRVRTRFERDDSVDSITHYDSRVFELDINSGSVAKHISRNVEAGKVSSIDEDESVTKINDDVDSEKYTVHSQHVPIVESLPEISEQELMDKNQKRSRPEYVSKSISKLPDISDNEVVSNRYKVTDNSVRELVMQSENIADDERVVSKNDTGKIPNEKKQKMRNTLKRSVSANKYYHSPGASNPEKPINTTKDINHKDSYKVQSKQHQQVTSELSLEHFENNIRPEKSLLESQLRTISKQNINFKPQNLLQTSSRLASRRRELNGHDVFLKDSNVETGPVTNITIGRVEVRAIPPKNDEKTKHKKKPSGIMSLDKYLSRQKQGGNR
jgi:hypothetical protein